MLGAGLTESAEVDQPPDPRPTCGGGEVRSPAAVAFGEVRPAAASHRMHEVVGDLGVGEGTGKGRLVEHVAADDLAADRLEVAGPGRVAHQAADCAAVLAQRAGQQATDVAGRPGYEHGEPGQS